MSENDLQELCDLTVQTCTNLRRAVQNTTLQQRSQFNAHLKDLQDAIKLLEISSSFRKSAQEVDQNWIPKGIIERVLRACCNERYKDHHIEAIFYQHGDISGLLALYLGTKGKTALFTELEALSLQHKEDLAREFKGCPISPVASAWSASYNRAHSTSFTSDQSFNH